jgi:hypothetical protein
MTYLGHANDGRGIERGASARLLRPDGTQYAGDAAWKREVREREMMAGWGELLSNPRGRCVFWYAHRSQPESDE